MGKTIGETWKELCAIDAEEISGLTWRQRRKMGLTRFGVFRAVRQLQGSVEWDPKAPIRLIAADVAMVLAGHPDHMETWDEVMPTLDWETILAFIEKILPLILMLIELFAFI